MENGEFKKKKISNSLMFSLTFFQLGQANTDIQCRQWDGEVTHGCGIDRQDWLI